MLTPANWGEAPIGRRVVVAWKVAKQVRALTDAGPLIAVAADISVAALVP